MRELSLFAGAGGGLLGTHLLGWTPVGYVEWNEHCQRILAARIADGFLPVAPIFTDVRQFIQSGAAEQYRGVADVVTAGFPCQPFSFAGKRRGEHDNRNMWPATRDVIRVVRPDHVLLENSPGVLVCGYVGSVVGDLAALGYVGRYGCISAANTGADHQRTRWWLVAHSLRGKSQLGRHVPRGRRFAKQAARNAPWKPVCEPGFLGKPDGMADRMDRNRAIGNGQVPRVVRTAWELLA